uniref:Uncharacterized protein n=1 Tax=Nicotiana tabacum TaxID=4097 RepID=A0A1S3X9F2_TOBAC|nr:PREDICTED: uncharacterized protein LOC107762672 [Nicotiana tabacum]
MADNNKIGLVDTGARKQLAERDTGLDDEKVFGLNSAGWLLFHWCSSAVFVVLLNLKLIPVTAPLLLAIDSIFLCFFFDFQLSVMSSALLLCFMVLYSLVQLVAVVPVVPVVVPVVPAVAAVAAGAAGAGAAGAGAGAEAAGAAGAAAAAGAGAGAAAAGAAGAAAAAAGWKFRTKMPFRRFCGRTIPCAVRTFLQLDRIGTLRPHNSELQPYCSLFAIRIKCFRHCSFSSAAAQ